MVLAAYSRFNADCNTAVKVLMGTMRGNQNKFKNSMKGTTVRFYGFTLFTRTYYVYKKYGCYFIIMSF